MDGIKVIENADGKKYSSFLSGGKIKKLYLPENENEVVRAVEYLTEKRMERAKELLRYSGKRSSEVAYEGGYRDPRYFSFLFKKTQGCTPSSYRAGNGDGHEAK